MSTSAVNQDNDVGTTVPTPDATSQNDSQQVSIDDLPRLLNTLTSTKNRLHQHHVRASTTRNTLLRWLKSPTSLERRRSSSSGPSAQAERKDDQLQVLNPRVDSFFDDSPEVLELRTQLEIDNENAQTEASNFLITVDEIHDVLQTELNRHPAGAITRRRHGKSRMSLDKRHSYASSIVFPELLQRYWDKAGDVRVFDTRLIELQLDYQEDVVSRGLIKDQGGQNDPITPVFEKNYRIEFDDIQKALDAAIVEADELKRECEREGYPTDGTILEDPNGTFAQDALEDLPADMNGMTLMESAYPQSRSSLNQSGVLTQIPAFDSSTSIKRVVDADEASQDQNTPRINVETVQTQGRQRSLSLQPPDTLYVPVASRKTSPLVSPIGAPSEAISNAASAASHVKRPLNIETISASRQGQITPPPRINIESVQAWAEQITEPTSADPTSLGSPKIGPFTSPEEPTEGTVMGIGTQFSYPQTVVAEPESIPNTELLNARYPDRRKSTGSGSQAQSYDSGVDCHSDQRSDHHSNTGASSSISAAE